MQSLLSYWLKPNQQLGEEQLDNTGPNFSPVSSAMKGHCPQTVKLILNISTFDICFILVLPLEVQIAILQKKSRTAASHNNPSLQYCSSHIAEASKNSRYSQLVTSIFLALGNCFMPQLVHRQTHSHTYTHTLNYLEHFCNASEVSIGFS